MADRYQDRPSSADHEFDRGDRRAPKGESDPLAELARLIGQTDPFANFSRDNQQSAAVGVEREAVRASEPDIDNGASVNPPPWMQHRNLRPVPSMQAEERSEHPLRRLATGQPANDQEYNSAPPFADSDAPDPTEAGRYDDALYGRPDAGTDGQPYDQSYSDDPYAYQDGYGDETEEPTQKRRGGIITVVAVVALAIVGTGAAFAYRTYLGSPRSGEPPVIKADAGPNKIVPAGDSAPKSIQDRYATANTTEKLVSREEQPVDVKDGANSGPRVVFPSPSQNGNPARPVAAQPSPFPPATPNNGTLAGDEPRKVRTLSVRPDQAGDAAKPVTAARGAPVAPPVVSRAASQATSPGSNGPLSLSPQATSAVPSQPTRLASTNPAQPAASAGGGYVVQVSSQRNESDAQASFKSLQGKFPSVLGSRSPLIKRADLGDKGVYYRAMVGPFGSPDEASQFCGSLKSAGGQCVVQRN